MTIKVLIMKESTGEIISKWKTNKDLCEIVEAFHKLYDGREWGAAYELWIVTDVSIPEEDSVKRRYIKKEEE